LPSNTQSGRNAPARHWATASIGLLTGRIDVLADQLHRDLAAALVGHVGHLLADRPLHRDGDDLVFLLGPVPPILNLPGPAALMAATYSCVVLYGGIGVDPEHELVERHHRNRREILPRERDAGRQRRREQVGEGDHQLVRVPLGRS
jgi:hypothetical protein